ncbi:MAG: GIY-YIG nuclease family protein [Candidatus Thiodiazotropha sp.]
MRVEAQSKAGSGTYLLMLSADTRAAVQIGRWGVLAIKPGYYLYVGSAFGPGGVPARVARHCREAKKKHWHIDYLREAATVSSVWYSQAGNRLEHRWAQALSEWSEAEPVQGFGCSDCSCEAHLFHLKRPATKAGISEIVGSKVKAWSCDKTV